MLIAAPFFTKHFFFYSMKRGPCDIISQQLSINNFVFDQEETALVIKAQTDEILYCS
jgi:hypothetical protein